MNFPRSAWIVDGIRTPFGRYGGALARVRTGDLGALLLLDERSIGLLPEPR